MATMTIRLDEELDARLSAVAEREGKTRSELARELLRRHLLAARLTGHRHHGVAPRRVATPGTANLDVTVHHDLRRVETLTPWM